MSRKLNRRDFLKLGTLSACATAFRPIPPEVERSPVGLGRVTTSVISHYSEPSFQSRWLEYIERDELIPLLESVRSDDGPYHNPRWYRTSGGYVHSGRIQPVQWNPQVPESSIPETGAVFEISVPYARSYSRPDPTSTPYYRLYYESTAWVEEVVQGVDGRSWYGLLDDALRVRYYVRAEHLRRVHESELTPLSPDVPPIQKRIEINLAQQVLRAFESGQLVFRTRISSGIPNTEPGPNGVPTITPSGLHVIDRKMPLRHMGDCRLTSSLAAYELPGVPWVSFFHPTGVAFHGAYWHDDFGRPSSHGCINMRNVDAKWLYRWSTPVVPFTEMRADSLGTRVYVY
jgi:lipoprotein-anchoring transpeptidase ErfK/SrfK